MMYLFSGCENLESIDFPNLNTSNVRYFTNMFSDCYNLEYINIENYKGEDIFDSIPLNNNLTICLKDDIIPPSLIRRKVNNNCLYNDYTDITTIPVTTIPVTTIPTTTTPTTTIPTTIIPVTTISTTTIPTITIPSTTIQTTTISPTTIQTTTIPIIVPSPSSTSIGLIIGIVIGGIAFIAGIIIAVILFGRIPPALIPNPDDDFKKLKRNKILADNLLKKLKIKIYYKNKIKDCPKCIICNQDSINNLSRIITTNCGHTFHQPCFKDHLYANLNCPKCPICFNFLLESNSEVNANISNPTIT